MNQYCTRISILFLTLTAIISSSNSVTKICKFTYPENFPDEESLLVWNYSLLILPENNEIKLNAGYELIVACPGSTNSLVQNGEKFSVAKCVDGETLQIGNAFHKLKDLGCSNSVNGEFQDTVTSCASNKGVIKNIGFYVNNEFLALYDICYDNNRGEALYSEHAIIGPSIAYAKPENMRVCYNEGGLALGINTDNYDQTAQLEILTELLGSTNLANNYIFPGSYLVAGHLVPYADHIYVTYALSTFFYINTVPQWQQIINGNWKSLEIAIRSVASHNKENLQVETGSWGVLQLEDVNGNLVDIYLSGDKLPVPKFVWKIAYSEQSKKGIAFVIVNNPFLKEVKDYICTNICDTYGWGTVEWSNAAKGLLYCCDVHELRKEIDYITNFDIIDNMEGFSASKILKRLFDIFYNLF